jgi:hypothetical protein
VTVEAAVSITKILFLAAAVLFFIAAIGLTILPNAMIWAFFCLALGLLLNGYDFSFKKQ